MKKRLLSLCMALILTVSLAPTVFADGPDELNSSYSDSGDGWTWNHTTRTLTLSGANFSGYEIKAENGATVVLEDGTTNRADDIYFSGKLTIRGGGSLTTRSISGWGDLTIESGTISVTNSTVNALDCENITLSGGKLTVEAATNELIHCDSKFLMTGGELNATAMSRDGELSNLPSNAILNKSLLKANQIEITGGTVTLAAPDHCQCTLNSSNGGTGQTLILRNCSLAWADSGNGNLAMFDNVTIDNAKLQWANKGTGSKTASIYASNPPAITNLKAESYSVRGPVDLNNGQKRYFIDFAQGGSVPASAIPSSGTQPSAPQPSAPQVETPSGWAQQFVSDAVAANIVPEALQSKYNQSTTRAEFCALAVKLYETVNGRSIEGRSKFNDTTDVNVEKAAYLGVISGVGSGNARPDGNITREQAAVMLTALAKACGKPLPESAHSFTDTNISGWANTAVGQVKNAGIMNGTGATTFSPQSQYTREQSIVTMLALFRYVK